METQENLEDVTIGTKEATKLQPSEVEIVKAYIEEVGTKNAKKVVCEVSHPQSQDAIKISSAKVQKEKNKLEVCGLWVNLDEDKLIRKNSNLAKFLTFLNAPNISGLSRKKCQTILDDNGYLVFKAY